MSYYLVDKCGDHRTFYGPQASEAACRSRAGAIYHAVEVQDPRVEDGYTVPRATLEIMRINGSVKPLRNVAVGCM